MLDVLFVLFYFVHVLLCKLYCINMYASIKFLSFENLSFFLLVSPKNSGSNLTWLHNEQAIPIASNIKN